MTISETFQIQASTPPEDFPHTTAAEELARLPQYLTGTRERDDGTDYIVTSAPYRDAAGNRGRIFVSLDETTNAIAAIQSFVNGVWTNWKVDAESIADGAVVAAKIPDKGIPGIKLPDAFAGDGVKFTDTTVGDVTTRVLDADVDDTSIAVDAVTKKLRIKEDATDVTMVNPRFTWHAIFNYGLGNEFQVGSNTEGDYSQCYLNSAKGVPINLYVMPTASAPLGFYQFNAQQVAFNQNGRELLFKLDSNSNVFYETTAGATQNQVWKSTLATTASVAPGLSAGETMMLIGDGRLLLRKLSLLNAPDSAVGLTPGEVWRDGENLKVVL